MRNAVHKMLEAIRSAMPDLKSVEFFSGRFSPASVNRVAASAPAVMLTVLGVSGMAPAPDGTRAALRMAAYLLVKDGRGSDQRRVNRDLEALRYAGGMLELLNNEQLWPLESPQQVTGDNLYSSSEQSGVALWGISWSQDVTLGTTALQELNEFLSAGVRWDVFPADGQPEMQETITVREA
jgi:hypothetical protein